MVRKKEDPEKVKARVKRYLENKQQLLITGLSEEEKNSFINIPGLEIKACQEITFLYHQMERYSYFLCLIKYTAVKLNPGFYLF